MSKNRRDCEHGTVSCYVNRKCRCTGCVAAKNKYARDRHKIGHTPRSPLIHGRHMSLYTHKGCRCAKCTALVSAVSNARYHKRNLTPAQVAAEMQPKRVEPQRSLSLGSVDAWIERLYRA